MAQGKYRIAEQGRVGGGDIAEKLNAKVVQDDIEQGARHGDIHGELVLVKEKLNIGKGCVHKGKHEPDGHRRDDVDSLIVTGRRKNVHDLRGEGREHKGTGRDADKDQKEHVVQLTELLLLQLVILPGDQGVVDALGDDLHDHARIIGDTVQSRSRHADQLLDHDPVKLVQDVLGDIVHQEGDIKENGEFRVLFIKPGLCLPPVVHKQADPETEIDENTGNDPGVSFFCCHQDSGNTQGGVEPRHQKGAVDDRLIDVFVAFPDRPEIDGRCEQKLQEDRDHDKGRQLGQGIDLLSKDQVDRKEGGGQQEGNGLHGGGVSVPVLLEFAHSLIEHGVIETQSDKDRKDLQPGVVYVELPVLLGAHQPGKDRQRDHRDALLQDAADYKPYGSFRGNRDCPVAIQ